MFVGPTLGEWGRERKDREWVCPHGDNCRLQRDRTDCQNLPQRPETIHQQV